MDDILDLNSLFGKQYNKKRILVTGHTGFKGTWLAIWLEKLGAEVVGISLEPNTNPNHWNLISAYSNITSHICDIRDKARLDTLISDINPDFIFHLAAQPIVLHSYEYPLETMQINIMGTANVLEAARASSRFKGAVMVTTDKCYLNQNTSVPYPESMPLGGRDPYSASKACSEIVIASYRHSFFSEKDSPLIASCRGGNVVGGGDWSDRRLIPDLIRATIEKSPVYIRHPNAVRPWQHVLDCLSGYLLLGQKLLEGDSRAADAWNIGPHNEDSVMVQEVIQLMKTQWPNIQVEMDTVQHPHEETLLQLSIEKIKSEYGWEPVWTIQETIQKTTEWYYSYYHNAQVQTESQILEYCKEAKQRGYKWALN